MWDGHHMNQGYHLMLFGQTQRRANRKHGTLVKAERVQQAQYRGGTQ